MEKLSAAVNTLHGDINDFLEENDLNNCIMIEDIDRNIDKITDLRSLYRNSVNEAKIQIDDFDTKYGSICTDLMAKVKMYIKEANDKRHKLRMKDFVYSQEQVAKEERKWRFILNELNRSMDDLESHLIDDIKELDDEEVQRKQSEVSDLKKKLHHISSKVTLLADKDEGDVDASIKRYDLICTLLYDFEKKVKEEVVKREIDKEKLFKEGKLNIKLGRFKDFDSALDIYTFQDNFEKLYLRTTPRRLLPDLLKNNHLENPALLLVKSVENIDEIWSRLKQMYGDPKTMLSKRLDQLNDLEAIWKLKNSEKISDSLNKIVNLLKDLLKLSKRHNIEAKLYNGDTLDKVYKIIGDVRMTKWLEAVCDEELENEELWERFIEFLEKECKIQQTKVLLWHKNETSDKSSSRNKEDSRKSDRAGRIHHTDTKVKAEDKEKQCSICGETGHVSSPGPSGSQVIQYYACEKFASMSPKERFEELRKKNLCFQCLLPGASFDEPKHRKGWCQKNFACQHSIHSGYTRKKHFLVCEEHKDTKENQELLQSYKEKFIFRQKQLPDFSKNIQLVFHQDVRKNTHKVDDCTDGSRGIYQLQTIEVDGKSYNIFYDTGCGDFVSKKSAIQQIGEKATLEYEGPMKMSGVGGLTMETPHGVYTVRLPLEAGGFAAMTGMCLNEITGTFPAYPLQGIVENDIHKAYRKSGGNVSDLPQLPAVVGGNIDFMVGIKYLRYHPKQVFQLPSGLTIYQSVFTNKGGGNGVIGGPHKLFAQINDQINFNEGFDQMTFLSNQMKLYQQGFQINPDVSLLGFKTLHDQLNYHTDVSSNDTYLNKAVKRHEECEAAGTLISYRCVKCRNCLDCKHHDTMEEVSIKEEIEQDIINKSVTVDLVNRCTEANLPFTHDPKTRLAPNRHKALKVLYQQVKKLNKNDKDKKDVVSSEAKLQSLGHVDYIKNLTQNQQEMLQTNDIQNYIPWRSVWKCTSLSTPCRLVFDASQPTSSGYSLNDVLAKGRNNMNHLQEILIRWFTHIVGFHTDVQKMYNSVRLKPEDWCYQRYLWINELDPNGTVQEKVIKTLIYGVKSSGNQAERGLRQTAKMSEMDYPEVSRIVEKDVYVDDCISGESTLTLAKSRSDELELVLNKGGFTLKGISFTGEDPPEKLTDDSKSIGVGGMRWYTKDDELTLEIGELCFSRKLRGRKIIDEETRKIPEKLTRRHCVSKVSEVFDLTGKVTPIISAMKLDLHELITRKLCWDDCIPDDLRRIWLENFDTLQQLNSIRWKRAVVPKDAKNLDIETLDFGDASRSMTCSAIYARFQTRNGNYTCQLVLGRSKIVPDGTSQPRAELIASVLNTHSGEIVRRAFGSNHKKHIKLSDSQIVLCWIKNNEKPLNQWVRNRVIEICRFTKWDDWFYVESENMIADLGTRKNATIDDVGPESVWINGFNWMKLPVKDMPIHNVASLQPSKTEMTEIKKEFRLFDVASTHISRLPHESEIRKRVELSKYILDPNKFGFNKVTRIISYVYKFINCLKLKTKFTSLQSKSKSTFLHLTNDEIEKGKQYYFKKATKELKYFNSPKFYSKFGTEKDGIIWYTGRILPTDEITITGRFTTAMHDLVSSTFCVPVIDKHSPLAYSIISYVHWYDKDVKHSGVESVWRHVLKIAYIVEGRSIVKMIRKSCERCRYLEKRHIEVLMGPVSTHNLTIAPAFYIVQVDLAGPFSAYSPLHKRTTIKVWFAVFCCATTSAIKLKLMEDYSSEAFIQSFIRLSCEVGYPKVLLPDEGGQLMKSCETMQFKFQDIKNRLVVDAMVEFEPCPVGAHYMHGRVERKILEVKKSIEKNFQNERLSVIQWETVGSQVANAINDMPLAHGNIVSDFELTDLLTPNRLLLGHNNDRSPVGPLTVTSNPDKFIVNNQKIFDAWFEAWLLCHVPHLMEHPKWFRTTHDLKVGDVILFLKRDSTVKRLYQYGVIEKVQSSKDGIIRKVIVKYKNADEKTFRETNRSTRELVVIHGIDEIDIIKELGKIGHC